MKRSLTSAALAFGAAALLGLAGSHARADGPATPYAPLPSGPSAGVPTTAALAADAPAGAPAAPAATAAPAAPPVLSAPPAVPCPPPLACAPACEVPLKKVCQPEPATREVPKRSYGESCEDFCLPKCKFSGLGHLFHHGDCDAGCADGTCHDCECPRTRKYLVVKIKQEQECYTKCNVGYVPEEPSCGHKLFGHKSAGEEGACLPPVEGLVAPPLQAPPEKMPRADGGAEKIGPPKDK
jgi:hypothetical protein